MARTSGPLLFVAGLLLGSAVLGQVLGGFVVPDTAPVQWRSERAGQGIEALAQHNWFASGAQAQQAAAPSANLRLIGLIAASRQSQGVALIQRDGVGKPLVLVPGAAPEQGLQVLRIQGQTVELLEHGRPVSLSLPAVNTSLTSSPSKD